MLISDIMSRVRTIAGDNDILQFSQADLLQWVNDGVRECAIQNSLLQKRATQSTVLNQEAYDLPADVLKLHSVKYDNEKIRAITLEEFDASSTSVNDRGIPVLCYVWAGKLHLYPTPNNSTSVITIDYLYDPAVVLIANIGVTVPPLPVEYHARLIDYCLAQVAQQDDDLNRYSVKMEEFRTGVQSLKDQRETEDDIYPFISVTGRDSGEYDYGQY